MRCSPPRSTSTSPLTRRGRARDRAARRLLAGRDPRDRAGRRRRCGACSSPTPRWCATRPRARFAGGVRVARARLSHPSTSPTRTGPPVRRPTSTPFASGGSSWRRPGTCRPVTRGRGVGPRARRLGSASECAAGRRRDRHPAVDGIRHGSPRDDAALPRTSCRTPGWRGATCSTSAPDPACSRLPPSCSAPRRRWPWTSTTMRWRPRARTSS